ncbi:hypothetical protein IEQ34_007336 [Dendrobium chrysotoxum]|uniref:Fanconi-associated nuclease n=1 Tax=Dendrobium chrysotoxum TaxID=161865 RepID=A0AAV7GRT1_DENCH|nr:hypothetical protein IEQ34_007336 [Dendrobium chrysotoxum]
MLHGRESIIRLIGKRRRAFTSLLARSLRSKANHRSSHHFSIFVYLDPFLKILFTLQDGSDYGEAMCVNSMEDDPVTNDGGEIENTRKRGSEACVEWVCCPVCAVSVRGDDFTVNSHLDLAYFGSFYVDIKRRPVEEECREKAERIEILEIFKCFLSNWYQSNDLGPSAAEIQKFQRDFWHSEKVFLCFVEERMAGKKVEVLEGEFGQLKSDLEGKFLEISTNNERLEGRFSAMEEMMKKLLEMKTNPATLEVRETTDGHGIGGNLNPSRGRRMPEVEILQGENDMPPLESLSREEMSMGYDRRGVDFGGRREEFHRRGTDFEDACLANGKKRKLNQRTLLQVNFLSKSRQETCLIEANSPNMDKCEKELFEEKQLQNFHHSNFLMLHGSCEKCESESLNQPSLYNSEFSSQTSILEVVDEDAVKRKAADPHIPSTFPSIIRSPRSDSCEDIDTKYVYTLETLIVGRRFHKKIDLQPGGRVYVVRECQNVKDDNAIQVFSDHQGFRCSLGYLPRKLAKYLSPLIDYHHLNCEGSILSLPEHPLHDVPIKLFCKKVVRDGDIISAYQEDFELLWEKVLFANESAKSQPISMTKYQQNFRLMLEDVLDNYSHLFTKEEKCFIGYFSSLSDDAQRLLVRLYTRKGPWFRLSNISYKEISDLNAAMHELQMTGYLCSLGSAVQSFKYNMKEVLDVLTVSELQQISHQWLSKNGMHHRRKQEIIEYILSASKNGSCSALLQKMVLEHAGKCVMISSAVDAILWRIQRLFFLNSEQDLSAFLLVDMGLIKFPEFTCTITQQIFKCRADFLEYEEAIEVAQIMDESIDQSDMEMTKRCIELSDNRMLSNFSEEILSSVSGTQLRFFHYFSASWVYSKLLTLGVSFYEREHRYGIMTILFL